MTQNKKYPKSSTTSQLNNNDVQSELKKKWAEIAEGLLLGRTIIGIRYLTDAESAGWDNAPIAIHLDDGAIFCPVRDDEGNDAGAIFYRNGDDESEFPVICNY